MISNEERNRLCWRSRRGVLELDLLLGPFIQEMYETLTPEQRKTYALLLEQEDTDLLDWFARKKVADNDSLQELVDIILDHA